MHQYKFVNSIIRRFEFREFRESLEFREFNH